MRKSSHPLISGLILFIFFGGVTMGIAEKTTPNLVARIQQTKHFHTPPVKDVRSDGSRLEAIGDTIGTRATHPYYAFKTIHGGSTTTPGGTNTTLPKPVGETETPPPRPKFTCGAVTTREIGDNIGEKDAGNGYVAQPTLAVFRNQVHLLINYKEKGSWKDYVPNPFDLEFEGVPAFENHYIYNGSEWSAFNGGTPRGKMALAVYNVNLWAVWKDNEKKLWFSRFFNQWAPPTQIPDQFSKSAPAIAVRQGVLHMVHNGKSSDDLWYSSYTPQTQWTPNVKIGQKSRTTPGLTLGSDGNLHMVYLGAAKTLQKDPKELWYSQFDGNIWTTPFIIQDQSSKAPPTLLGAGTTSPLLLLHMVHLGKSENTLWSAAYGKNPRFPADTQQNRWQANEKLLRLTSDGPVALTFFQGCIQMVHKVGKKLMHTRYSIKDVHKGIP